MARPHILIIPPWFDIDFQHNFAKSYHQWARDIAKRYDVQIGLLYGEFSPGQKQRKYFQNKDLDYHYLGVKGWGLPKAGPGWTIWKRQYRSAFQEYVRRHGMPTVIHGHSLLGLIAAEAIHRRSGVPFVYTEVLGAFITGSVAKRLVRQGQKAVRRASFICGISPGMVKALQDTFNVPAELISLYVDGGVFYPEPQREGPPQFISIGAPAKTKGMDVLIEAMALVVLELPDAQLTIADKLSEQAVLEKQVKHLRLDDCIHFVGDMPHDHIPGYIHQSHVLVSASRIESLGMTMMEALSCGRPVVATDTPGSQYIVEEEMGEIVPKENPQKLANAMVKVYRSRSLYDSQDLHARIQSRFGKCMILEQWMDVYHRSSNQSSL